MADVHRPLKQVSAAPTLIAEVPPEILQKNVLEVQTYLREHPYRDQPPAKLIAVTKTVAPDVINRLAEFQVLDIGENRAQVALPKLPLIDPQLRLHWLGRLQTNKVKDIIDKVWLLHSLDRADLADEVERRADQRGLRISALAQVNIAGESQKAGFAPQEVRAFLRRMKDYRNLHICGLMTILPLIEDEAALSAYFRAMRELFDQLRQEAAQSVTMEELSMGMSHDYRLAVNEGATMVRIGTALYRRD
jgi:PLP dependent protein